MNKICNWLYFQNILAPAAALQVAAVIGWATASDTSSEPGSTTLD